VHLVSEHVWCDDYLVRSFYLKNVKTGETRTVTQFHFLSWPEGGVPHSTKALLEFRRYEKFSPTLHIFLNKGKTFAYNYTTV
jgi:protein tyrosine phosphatase